MKKRHPKGAGLPILYLDFDGVLHPEHCYWHPRKGPYLKAPGHELFEHVEILERLLEPYPQIVIVLSTSWVQTYRFSATAGKLSQRLRERVVGSTFHTEMDLQAFRDVPRGRQIWSDVLRRQPSEWVALDDDESHWPAEISNRLVHTDGLLGLGEERVQQELQQHFERLAAGSG